MRFPYLYLEVTRACNQRCKQCFNNSGSALPFEMSTREVCDVVTRFKAQGGQRLQITGGEALYRGDIFEIFSTISDLKFDYVVLSTNGMLFGERTADRLRPVVDEIDISLDGYREDHDFMRGVKSYDLARRAIRIAADRNYFVYVCTCLNPNTWSDIDAFIEDVISLGANVLKIAETGYVGRKLTPDELLVGGLEPADIYNRIRGLQFKYKKRIAIGQSYSMSPVVHCFEREAIVCTPDGSLYPLIGDLPSICSVGRASPTWEIWADRLNAFIESYDCAIIEGIKSITNGTPINWWTLIHNKLESTAKVRNSECA